MRTNRRLPFEPAAVLPVQVLGPREALQPEKSLMLAVLEDAIATVARQPRYHEPHLAPEAWRWILSNRTTWPFAFVNVCAALGIDPHYLRKGLARWLVGTPSPRQVASGVRRVGGSRTRVLPTHRDRRVRPASRRVIAGAAMQLDRHRAASGCSDQNT